jgi:hypothetical protein
MSLMSDDVEFLVHPSKKSPEFHFPGLVGWNPGKHLHTTQLLTLQLPNFPQAL